MITNSTYYALVKATKQESRHDSFLGNFIVLIEGEIVAKGSKKVVRRLAKDNGGNKAGYHVALTNKPVGAKWNA